MLFVLICFVGERSVPSENFVLSCWLSLAYLYICFYHTFKTGEFMEDMGCGHLGDCHAYARFGNGRQW